MSAESRLDQKVCSGEHFFQRVNDALSSTSTRIISFVNPFSYAELLKQPVLIDAIDDYFADGALLVRLHSMFVQPITRASFDFSSIADDFFLLLAQRKFSLAVIGAKD